MVVLNGEVCRFLQQVGMTCCRGLCQHSFIETIKTSKTVPASILIRIGTSTLQMFTALVLYDSV